MKAQIIPYFSAGNMPGTYMLCVYVCVCIYTYIHIYA